MKSIVLDTGPIISMVTNNLLWLLEPLKNHFKGDFFITKNVKMEMIDHPMQTKKFKFEALQVLNLLENNVIEVADNSEIQDKAVKIFDSSNSIYQAKGKAISILHRTDTECIAAAVYLSADALVVDERTLRLVIEEPEKLRYILEHKLHTKVTIDDKALRRFKSETKLVKVIRSIELVTVAYELGLLNKYILHLDQPKKNLLDAALWGLKLNGAAVSEEEIKEIITTEVKDMPLKF
jgi:hypothetical protein